jgi:hypothetical protein
MQKLLGKTTESERLTDCAYLPRLMRVCARDEHYVAETIVVLLPVSWAAA